MATRIFLALNALVWLPYGLYCFLDPGFLGEAAGVGASSATGTIELRAMYGGLQAGIGVLTGLAVFRPALVRPALVTVAFLCGGLFVARGLGAALAGTLSAYTAAGLGFELAAASVALLLLARQPLQVAPLLVALLLVGCTAGAGDRPETPPEDYVPCSEPRPEMCTMQHDPVCAQRDTGIRCVTTPCDSTESVTRSNACIACRDPKVYGYRPGACADD